MGTRREHGPHPQLWGLARLSRVPSCPQVWSAAWWWPSPAPRHALAGSVFKGKFDARFLSRTISASSPLLQETFWWEHSNRQSRHF